MRISAFLLGATASFAFMMSAQAAPDALTTAQPQSPQVPAIPKALLGTWTINSVAGDAPTMLEVDSLHKLIGRRITVSEGHLAIWSVLDGKPTHTTQRITTLASIVAEPDSMKQGHDFPDAHKPLTYVYVYLDQCKNDGIALAADACPLVCFAIDPQTGAVSFIPFSWSMAHLKRVSG